MRKIEVIDDVRLRFRGRGDEFDLGFEIGVIAAALANGAVTIKRYVSPDCLEQVRPLADLFRYTVVTGTALDGLVFIFLEPIAQRPKLRIVRG